jgi:hypothetical protein
MDANAAPRRQWRAHCGQADDLCGRLSLLWPDTRRRRADDDLKGMAFHSLLGFFS